LISLAQVLGMDASDVHDLYNQKNKLNFKRQDDGYAVKDENDNRDLG
jgi:dimeric dUTPase (all-alpha-NTP-PPase superfamily)